MSVLGAECKVCTCARGRNVKFVHIFLGVVRGDFGLKSGVRTCGDLLILWDGNLADVSREKAGGNFIWWLRAGGVRMDALPADWLVVRPGTRHAVPPGSARPPRRAGAFFWCWCGDRSGIWWGDKVGTTNVGAPTRGRALPFCCVGWLEWTVSWKPTLPLLARLGDVLALRGQSKLSPISKPAFSYQQSCRLPFAAQLLRLIRNLGA